MNILGYVTLLTVDLYIGGLFVLYILALSFAHNSCEIPKK